jgi:hypothetical protein
LKKEALPEQLQGKFPDPNLRKKKEEGKEQEDEGDEEHTEEDVERGEAGESKTTEEKKESLSKPTLPTQ